MGISPVGDEGGDRAAAEQAREVLPRAEPLDEVEPDLDEVGAGGRGGCRVGLHRLHRARHQRHAQERHLSPRPSPASERAIGKQAVGVGWSGWV